MNELFLKQLLLFSLNALSSEVILRIGDAKYHKYGEKIVTGLFVFLKKILNDIEVLKLSKKVFY